MGRAFTPSRSAIYGAPEREALIDVGNTMLGQLQDWSDEQVQGEYRRQVSNASMAMEKERQGLHAFMRENQNDPGSWRTKFAADREKIHKSILAGITQPQAKQVVEAELNESLQKWEGWIDESAAKQTAVNFNADFETGVKSFLTESTQFGDQTDLMEHLGAAISHVDTNFGGGKLPPDMIPTQAAADALKRKISQKMIGDYLTQQALATGREDILDRANEIGEGVFGPGQPLFGPEDLGKLKETVTAYANAAKSETNKARTARADAFEKDVTIKLLRGEFATADEKGKPINLRDAIISNPDLEPEKIRALENLYQEQAAAGGKNKKYTDLEKLEAYIDIRTERDPEKKLGLLRKHAAGLGFNEVQSLYDKMNKPADGDDHLTSGLNTVITALRNVRTLQKKEPEIAKIHVDLLRLQDQVLRQWDAHPEWTADQKISYMELILAPAKQQAGKNILARMSDALGRFPTGMGAEPKAAPPAQKEPPDLPEPQSVDEWKKTTARLKWYDPEGAKAYYQKWEKKWQK